MPTHTITKPVAGLGNALEDHYYLTPWGEVERCFVITWHREAAAATIIRGGHGAEVSEKQIDKMAKGKPVKPSPAWIVPESDVFENHPGALLIEIRKDEWAERVLAAIPEFEEHGMTREELADKLGCKPSSLDLKSDGIFSQESAGDTIYFRKRSEGLFP